MHLFATLYEYDFWYFPRRVVYQPRCRVSVIEAIIDTDMTKHPVNKSSTQLIPVPLSMTSLALSFASKKEDESGLSSYYNNKTTIIQEARVFNDSPISPRKCRALLTRIVYLLYVGETFGTQEATTLFFGTTKLFQHKDVSVG